jgi:hypothetical protein
MNCSINKALRQRKQKAITEKLKIQGKESGSRDVEVTD